MARKVNVNGKEVEVDPACEDFMEYFKDEAVLEGGDVVLIVLYRLCCHLKKSLRMLGTLLTKS